MRIFFAISLLAILLLTACTTSNQIDDGSIVTIYKPPT